MADPNGRRHLIGGVILAAGPSARMGRPKQLLSFDGKPLIQHVIDEAMASSLIEVVLVLGASAQEVIRALEMPPSPRFRFVVNFAWADGQSSSLRFGLEAISPHTHAAAVLLGDQLGVTAPLIDQVADAFRSSQQPVARALYRTSEGTIQGYPAVIGREIWKEVEKLRGDEGMRALLARNPGWLQEVPVDFPPPLDIDTEEQYVRAMEIGSPQAAAKEEPATAPGPSATSADTGVG